MLLGITIEISVRTTETLTLVDFSASNWILGELNFQRKMSIISLDLAEEEYNGPIVAAIHAFLGDYVPVSPKQHCPDACGCR